MGKKPDYVNGQPEPIRNNSKSIHDLVRRDLAALHSNGAALQNASVVQIGTLIAERKQYGLEKYGTILQANNGRNAIQDAIEEALDLAVYLRQWLEESSQKDDPSARERVDQHLIQLVYRETLQSLVMIQTTTSGRA